MKTDNSEILARIDSRLKALKKSARGASIEAGLGPDVIRDMKRDPSVLPRLDTIRMLSKPLAVDPGWLAYGHEIVPLGSIQSVRVVGEVAAGQWYDASNAAEDFDPDQRLDIEASSRYPANAQYGVVVRGTSINRIAQPGEILRCIDVEKARIIPVDGDVVIVERRRAQGSQIEVTAKVRREIEGRVELWPDSTDARWTSPLHLDAGGDEDDSVRIVAVVDAVTRKLRRG